MSEHELNLDRINIFVNNKIFLQLDKIKFREMLFYLISRRKQYLFIKELNEIISLEDVMDNAGTEAYNLLEKVYNENKV